MTTQTLPLFTPADRQKLGKQLAAVRDCMVDGQWWTLARLSAATGYPEASLSARIRELKRVGLAYVRRKVGPGEGQMGQWEYRVIVSAAV